MGGVDDPRDPRSTTYALPCLLFAGILLFVGHLGSRRPFNDKATGLEGARGQGLPGQVWELVWSRASTAPRPPDGDTLPEAGGMKPFTDS